MSAIGQAKHEAEVELRRAQNAIQDEQRTLLEYAQRPVDEFSEQSAALMEINAKTFSKNLAALHAAQKVIAAADDIKGDETLTTKHDKDQAFITRVALIASRSSRTFSAQQGSAYSVAYTLAIHELLNAALTA